MIHIVTDSCAHFLNPDLPEQYPITVVPNRIEIEGRVFREGVDITTEDALERIARARTAPKLIPPSVADYAEVYARLAPTHSGIVSIHASRELLQSWQNARTAAQQVMGDKDIAVIDSRSLCVAQGILVHVAAQVIQQHDQLGEIVRLIRGAVERLYTIYYVESVDYLRHNAIMSPAHAILSTMLDVKPFLTVEDGKLVLIEKVKTRAQAIERLVEFSVEFVEIEQAAIVQHRPQGSEQARTLYDRLTQEFPDQTFTRTVYAASLACLIGTDATGVVILEKEMEDFYDDF